MAQQTRLFSVLTLIFLKLMDVLSIRNFFNHPIFSLLVDIVESEDRVNPALIVVHWCYVGVRHVHYLSFRIRRVLIFTSGIVTLGSIRITRSKTICILRLVLRVILTHLPLHNLLFCT